MWLLLFVPIVLGVVLILMLASLFAGLIWMIGAGWPVLLIGLGMWMLWHHDGRHRSRHAGRARDRRGGAADIVSSRANDSRPIGTQPVSARRASPAASTMPPSPQTALPGDVQATVEQIRRQIDVLLGYADRFPPFSQDLYLVRQTASDYLPRTIETYLGLPKHTAESPLGTGGRTAHQELKAQLDLLSSKLQDIARDLERQDSDRLLANRRFLESRFGMRDAQLPAEEKPAADVA